jgi:hypothetical protein
MLYINDTYLYIIPKDGDTKPKDANLVYLYVILGCLIYPIVYDGT